MIVAIKRYKEPSKTKPQTDYILCCLFCCLKTACTSEVLVHGNSLITASVKRRVRDHSIFQKTLLYFDSERNPFGFSWTVNQDLHWITILIWHDNIPISACEAYISSLVVCLPQTCDPAALYITEF